MSIPINIAIPTIATTVPNQNERLGLFLKNRNAITPTQIGAKLVSNVPCVAVVNCMDKFQNEISAANNIPQTVAKRPIRADGTLNVPVIVT